MSIEDNKALVRRLIEDVWNTGNYSELDTFVVPSIAESTKQLNSSLRVAFPDYFTQIDDMIAEGDKVVVRWTLQGTHQDELETPVGSIPPTGKHVTLSGMHIFRIAEGKLAERWAEADTLGLLQQLGVIPTPG